MKITKTIEAKSDQLNADDLIGGSKIIKITSVKVLDSDIQPVSISYEGDNGKPYKPSKGMRRVLVQLWGDESDNFIGKRLKIYRDDNVKFGGSEVGGIRISHASDIPGPTRVLETVSRGKRKPITIEPLIEQVKTLTDARFSIAMDKLSKGEIKKEDVTKFDLTELQIKAVDVITKTETNETV
jgi:hypothetical protein